MGQAGRRRESWGSRVAQPMLYVPVRILWNVVVRRDGDSRSEDFMRSAIRTEARIHGSIPTLFHPDRNPFEPCAIDFENPGSGIRFDPETDDEGNTVLFYESDLSLVRDVLGGEHIYHLYGQPGRIAVRTGDPVAVAIDGKGEGFVTREGPIADHGFFADKMIAIGNGFGLVPGDPMTLTMTTILRSDFSNAGTNLTESPVAAAFKHLGVFDRTTDAAVRDLPGAEADRIVFRSLVRRPEMLLDDADVMMPGDLFPRALKLFEDAYASSTGRAGS